jgi:hypothetical protein
MRLNVSLAGFCCLFWSSAFAQDATPAEREQEARAQIARQSGYGKTAPVQQVERVMVPPQRRVARPVRESVPPPPRGELEGFRVPAIPMKRVDGPGAPRFVRVTPEQYAAFAAEYQGNVKLFRPDESEIAVNAALLGELLETAATALRTNESARVKYYTGISHPLHGVMVQGSSRDPSVPPKGVYYHEFHEDNAGRVRAVVGNDVDGSRYVTDVLLYDQGRPYARLYYNRAGEFQQAIMVYYRGDQPYLTCRVGPNGTAHMELANAPAVVPEGR